MGWAGTLFTPGVLSIRILPWRIYIGEVVCFLKIPYDAMLLVQYS